MHSTVGGKNKKKSQRKSPDTKITSSLPTVEDLHRLGEVPSSLRHLVKPAVSIANVAL
jgi:hypothetical protein